MTLQFNKHDVYEAMTHNKHYLAKSKEKMHMNVASERSEKNLLELNDENTFTEFQR